MAASQASLELRNNTDANFRLWGKFISDGLAAGGWTKMDTDINWTTVNAPAQNNYAGYEVWESPDEAGLTNFYLKLRYGSHNSATVGPSIEAQVSWAYGGSGSSLGGTPSTAMVVANTSAASSTARFCTVAAGEGEVAFNLGGGVATVCAHQLTVERTRNTAVEKQNELAIMFQAHSAGGVINKLYTENSQEYTNTAVSNALSWFPFSQTLLSQVTRWGTVALMYATPLRQHRVSPVTLFLGTVANALGVAGEQVTIPIYGVNRNYMILGSAANAAGNWEGGNQTSTCGLILFE